MSKCECCGEREADAAHYVPIFGGYLCYSRECWAEFERGLPMCERVCNGSFVGSEKFSEKIRARRAALVASPKFYGAQPDPLPETLSAGTMVTNLQFDRASSEVRLVCGHFYEGQWMIGGCMRYGAAHFSVIDWSTVPIQEPQHDTIPAPAPTLKAIAAEIFDRSHCRECSRPERPVMATVGELCVYCDHATRARSGGRRTREQAALDHMYQGPDVEPREIAARARLEAFEKRNAPRVTATARDLAKGHPATWPSQDGAS